MFHSSLGRPVRESDKLQDEALKMEAKLRALRSQMTKEREKWQSSREYVSACALPAGRAICFVLAPFVSTTSCRALPLCVAGQTAAVCGSLLGPTEAPSETTTTTCASGEALAPEARDRLHAAGHLDLHAMRGNHPSPPVLLTPAWNLRRLVVLGSQCCGRRPRQQQARLGAARAARGQRVGCCRVQMLRSGRCPMW